MLLGQEMGNSVEGQMKALAMPRFTAGKTLDAAHLDGLSSDQVRRFMT